MWLWLYLNPWFLVVVVVAGIFNFIINDSYVKVNVFSSVFYFILVDTSDAWLSSDGHIVEVVSNAFNIVRVGFIAHGFYVSLDFHEVDA
jgi:hypothetical protein